MSRELRAEALSELRDLENDYRYDDESVAEATAELNDLYEYEPEGYEYLGA